MADFVRADVQRDLVTACAQPEQVEHGPGMLLAGLGLNDTAALRQYAESAHEKLTSITSTAIP